MASETPPEADVFAASWAPSLIRRFFEGGGMILILPAAMYFWGFMYYASYTEFMGMPFHGILLTTHDYVAASWFGSMQLIIYAGGSFCVLQVVVWGVGYLVDKLIAKIVARRSTTTLPKRADRLKADFYVLGAALVGIAGIVWLGANLAFNQAKSETEKLRGHLHDVEIYDGSGAKIPGAFKYVRDYGSTLLVQEWSEDKKFARGSRVFKPGSYSGFTLLRAERTELEEVSSASTPISAK